MSHASISQPVAATSADEVSPRGTRSPTVPAVKPRTTAFPVKAADELEARIGRITEAIAKAEADGSASSAQSGFLVQLGNPDVLNPMLAEIYSLPSESVNQDGAVRLIVEAEAGGGRFM